MRSQQVADGISWVGAIDWNLRDFHGFETPNGTTYNAYLVQGAEKTALVDTVKVRFMPELLSRVASVVPLEKIDYIVVNHVEPDHNGGLRVAAEAMPNAKIVASKQGVKGIAAYHGTDIPVEEVGADDSIDLGGKTIRFMPMSMVHWPDSMFSYVPESRTLMPNDAFGQHISSAERFADEVGLDRAIEELTIYYANILTPLSTAVGKALEKVVQTGWVCETIAPSHGVIWRKEHIPTVIDAYERLVGGETEDKLIVVYGTMWESTDAMAQEIADGSMAEGVDVRVFELSATPLAHVARHLLDSRALLLGSPTLHHGMLYRPAAFLQYIWGLKPKGKLGGVFGSYGWSGGATKQMRARMEEIGFEMPFDDMQVQYRPLPDDLESLRDWSATIAREVIERGKGQII